MNSRTFDGWKAVGRHVRRGERSMSKNEIGQPVFTRGQTDETKYFGRFDGGRFGDVDGDCNHGGPSEYDLNIGWDKS